MSEWESPFGEGKSGERERNPFWRLPLTTLSFPLLSSLSLRVVELFVSSSLVFFGSSSLLRTDSGWSFIRLPIQGGRVHYCGWNITGGMRRNLVCFFFFFIRGEGLGQVSFFSSLSLSFPFAFLSSKTRHAIKVCLDLFERWEYGAILGGV